MRRPWAAGRWWPGGGVLLLLFTSLAAACGGSADRPTSVPNEAAGAERSAADDPAAHLREDSGILDPDRHPRVSRAVAEVNISGPARAPFLPPGATHTPAGEPILRDAARPHLFGFDWLTNFGIRIVKFEEFDPRLLRDEIIPLNDPEYIDVDTADRIYADGSPVIHLDVNGDVRAYPVEILLWHEVLIDVVGGVPVLVTYCPLCNTAIAFDRRLGNRTLTFGTAGILRKSDLVMYDHQTESVWQQVGGTALIGDLVGARLTVLPSSLVSYGQFREAFPDALVLARPDVTGQPRRLSQANPGPIPYGTTPYTLYDDLEAEKDFRRLFRGDVDERLHFAERVAGLTVEEEAIAYPFSLLEQRRVIADVVGGRPVLIVWTPGARSALDQIVIEVSREVGAAAVFDPRLDGATLEFVPNAEDPQTFLDRGTGSTWDIFGRAVTGPLTGAQLTPIPHGTHLWFAWVAFEPGTTIAE